MDIFGVDFDYEEFEQYGDDYEAEEEEEEEVISIIHYKLYISIHCSSFEPIFSISIFKCF